MLDHLPLSEVLAACQHQTDLFRQGVASDDRFCLELWRRALEQHDEEAWRGLDALYRPMLVARIRHRRPELDAETIQEAVQRTFTKLWEKCRQGALSTHDHTLPQVLTYVWNALLQEVIAIQRQRRELPLLEHADAVDIPERDDIGVTDGYLDNQRILGRIRAYMTEEEWQVLLLRHYYGVSVPQIATRIGRADKEVYVILARVLRRLRNNPELQAFFKADADDNVGYQWTI